MTDDDLSNSEPTPKKRYIASVTPDELNSVDLELPIASSNAFEPFTLGDMYRSAATEAEANSRKTDAFVYALIENLLGMHFKPGDRAEPFGPLFRMSDRRSLIVSDLSPELVSALAAKAIGFKHPVARARVADLCWTANRKHGACATLAIDAYCESVEQILSGKLIRRDPERDPSDFQIVELLQRATQIAAVTKGQKPFPERIVKLVVRTRSDAFARRYVHGFLRSSDLDLDYEFSPPAQVAKEAEELSVGDKPSPNGHATLALIQLSARAYRYAKDSDASKRMIVRAAEWCVSCADAITQHPMIEAHWLTKAIALYGGARSEKTRRSELRKRLVDVQARGLDEFVPIGPDPIDLSDQVRHVKEAISGQNLANALQMLILASRAPDPQKLRSEAIAAMKDAPLASIFQTTIMDQGGKTKAQTPGASDDEDSQEAAIRHSIIQSEGIRRGVETASTLEPARSIINAEHAISDELLLPLVNASPFVPPGHEQVLTHGFSRWFGGDVISAASILVPQLENSLRYVLRNAGEDVSTMKNDGTQEDRSIQAIFDQMRDAVVRVLGEANAFQIENLFLFRMGPAVRHAIAHGQFSSGHFYDEDASYACWYIFHLCFLPLLSSWEEVGEYLALR